MTTGERVGFARRALDDLVIEEDAVFRHIRLYSDLKKVLRRDGYSFRILPETSGASWDRALFLNLTFWGAADGGDVLVDKRIPGDVVAHVAWHRLAARAFRAAPNARPSVEALFLGESIASAFDLYLVGRLLGRAPNSSFVSTQVPAMAQAAQASGMDDDAFEKMLVGVAEDPDDAFARLRELLFDATAALFASEHAEGALAVLTELESRPFAPLLHHYELANWVLYARAYGTSAAAPAVRALERSLRNAKNPLRWLTDEWVRPALA